MVTWELLMGWRRMGLAAMLALAPLAAQHRGPEAAPCATPELRIDVDGDGRADRVRWMRYDDDFWLDVTLAGTGAADGLVLRSTTRVAPAGAAAGWSLSAADVNRDGKMDVLVRDAAGQTTAWLSDGLAFAASATATTKVTATAAASATMLCAR